MRPARRIHALGDCGRDLIDPAQMAAPENSPVRSRGPALRRAGVVLVVILLAGLVAFALSRLELQRVGHALITASPGWIVLSLALMVAVAA